MSVLNINTDACVVMTNRLEKMHRSALPVSIRSALNSTAFDVKQNTLLASARASFIHRQPNFFKANSRVNMAIGFDVDNMKAEVGMKSLGGTNKAVEDLEQQERGGVIRGKSFIPLDDARTGKSTMRNVKAINKISQILGVVNARNMNGKTKQARFIAAATKAGGGGYVLGDDQHGNRTLWRIDSISSTRKNQKVKIRKTALYSYEQNRKVVVAGTNFMRTATMESYKKLEMYFVTEGNKQIERLMK